MLTHNLALALRHIRHTERPRIVWIDALSIDQSNDVEKGPQVALMSEIYRLASRVVAWLGLEVDDSNCGMELMDYLGSQVVAFSGGKGLQTAPGATDSRLSEREVVLPFDATELEAIYRLICRNWFDRLWVRQEIHLANIDSVVACGSREVAWQHFRTVLAALFAKKHKLFRLSSQLESRIDHIRGFFFRKFTRVTRNYLLEKHSFRGREGYIGIAPPSARSGDQVCMLVGFNATLILRPTGAGKTLLVGHALYGERCKASVFCGISHSTPTWCK